MGLLDGLIQGVAGGLTGAASGAADVAQNQIQQQNKMDLAKAEADIDVQKQQRIAENTAATQRSNAAIERQRIQGIIGDKQPGEDDYAFFGRSARALGAAGDLQNAESASKLQDQQLVKTGYGGEIYGSTPGPDGKLPLVAGSSYLRAEAAASRGRGGKPLTSDDYVKFTTHADGMVKSLGLDQPLPDPLRPLGEDPSKPTPDSAYGNALRLAVSAKLAQGARQGVETDPAGVAQQAATLLQRARANAAAKADAEAATYMPNGKIDPQDKAAFAKIYPGAPSDAQSFKRWLYEDQMRQAGTALADYYRGGDPGAAPAPRQAAAPAAQAPAAAAKPAAPVAPAPKNEDDDLADFDKDHPPPNPRDPRYAKWVAKYGQPPKKGVINSAIKDWATKQPSDDEQARADAARTAAFSQRTP